LAPMEASFPGRQDLPKGDDSVLRWAYRSQGDSGFIFINNYERLQNLSTKKNVRLKVCGIQLPKLTIPAGTMCILPVNIDGIRYATAQIIAKRNGNIYMEQLKGISTTISFKNGKVLRNIKAKGPKTPVYEHIYLLTSEEAAHLFLQEEAQKESTLTVTSKKTKEAGKLRTITIGVNKVAEEPTDEDYEQAAIYKLSVNGEMVNGSRDLMSIDYQGDCARLYVNGKLVADHFNNGRPFLFGLWRLPEGVKELELRILPMQSNIPVYLPKEADKTPGERIKHIQVRNIIR